jgi:hypothetical protein
MMILIDKQITKNITIQGGMNITNEEEINLECEEYGNS